MNERPYLDEAAAIAELAAISRNAQLWLMDRIGNRLFAYTLSHEIDSLAHAHEPAVERKCVRCRFTALGRAREATDGLMSDMQRIGLFETWGKREEGE